MRFKYTIHAEERLAERGFSKAEVELALRQGKPNDAKGGLLYKIVEIDDRKVKVIYRRDARKPGMYIIVTVYDPDQ